jgi:K+:H+ antiporter
MPEIHLLEELLIVLAVTISIVYVFQKLRVPAIVGFLLAGVIIGPSGWGLIKA